MNRRQFLHATGAGAVLAAIGCARSGATADSAVAGASAAAAPVPAGAVTAAAASGRRAVGLQLYTVREVMERDWEGTLGELAKIGYREMEVAGYYKQEPQRIRAVFDRLGLTSPSGHYPIEQMRASFDSVLTGSKTLGHQYIVCPYLQEPERTAAGYKKVAAELTRWAPAAKAQGMQLAYHNHDFEFAALGGGTGTGFDILMGETDPDAVKMELDLFWATKAGQDPVALFAKHKGRFPLWHVKDMKGLKGAQEMVPVGTGEIDFRRIFAAGADAGVTHFFVEQDNAGADALTDVRESFAGVQRILA